MFHLINKKDEENFQLMELFGKVFRTDIEVGVKKE